MNIDRLAELMPDQSPYNYAFNNPVFWIDPDGRMPEEGDAGGGSETAVGGFTNSQDSYGRDLSTASHTNSAPVGSEFGLEKKKGKNENKDNPSNNLNNDLNKNSPENIDNDGRVICIKCKEGEEMVFENKYIKNNKMYFEYENMFYHRGNLGEMGFYNEKDYIELYSEVLEFVKAQQISYQIFSEIISSNYMEHKLTNLAMKFDASDYGSKMISPAHNNVAKRFLHKAFGSFFTSQPLNNGGHIDFEDSNMPILEPKDTIYKTRRAGKHKFIDKN